MTTRRDVLVLGAESPPMQRLSQRIARLGYRTLPAKTPEQAHVLLRISRSMIGAVVLPPELPVLDLRRALCFMSALVFGSELVFLAAGPPPVSEERRRLRDAGVGLALFDPVDEATLRFQVNRALAGSLVVRGRRGALRAPGAWPVRVRVGSRCKETSLYDLSSSGAWLVTEAPSPRSSRVQVELPRELGGAALPARVVRTNVPGNLRQWNLPLGMSVVFEDPPLETEAAIHLWAEERLRALAV